MTSLDFFDSELLRSILKIEASAYLESSLSGKGIVPVGSMNDFEKKAYTVSTLYFKETLDAESVLNALRADGLDSASLRESMLDSMSKAGLAWDYMALSIRARFPKFRDAIAIAEGFNIVPFPDDISIPEYLDGKQADPQRVDFLIEYERCRIGLRMSNFNTQQ